MRFSREKREMRKCKRIMQVSVVRNNKPKLNFFFKRGLYIFFID